MYIKQKDKNLHSNMVRLMGTLGRNSNKERLNLHSNMVRLMGIY